MQVKIEEIQDKGLELNEKIPKAVLDEALEKSLGFKRKSEVVTLHAKLKKLAGRVLLDGAFKATLVAPCKRCVKDVTLDVPVKFELTLVQAEKRDDDDDDTGEGDDDGKSPRAGSFQITDADSEEFDGKTIQLDPIVSEQLLLALPLSVLCKEDCKGLCTVCGEDLNVTECGHVQKLGHVGLAKLKDLKLS